MKPKDILPGDMSVIPELETKNLWLRAMTQNDAEPLLKIYRDPETVAYWATPDRTIEDSQKRVQVIIDDWKHGFGDWALVDKATKQFIGFCGLHYISDMAEVNLGYIIDRGFWGRGLGTEASRLALHFGFERCNLNQIVATTDPRNVSSVKLLEKCGMSFWKKVMRKSRERSVYSISRSQWEACRGAWDI